MENKKENGLTTITTYAEVVSLAKVYCVFNDLKLKDFVAEMLERELSSFRDWLKKAKKLEGKV